MNKSHILATAILATLIGCSPQLKPNSDIDTYYITPGTGLSPTMLCGVTPSGEACLRMQDGSKVKTLLNGYFLNWLPGLKANQTIIANSGKSSYLIPTEQGTQLLQALIADEKQREFERWMKRDGDDE